jgi:hypothetical protein
MSVTKLHGLWAIVHDATVLGGINQLNCNTGTEVVSEPSSGEVYPRYQSDTNRSQDKNQQRVSLHSPLRMLSI